MHTTEQLNTALAGRYAIDRLIGEGGMATVYLARDVRHNRKVALKVLRPDLGAVVGVERFLSEIQVTANLQHPNLLPLFDSGEAGGLLFYVMPLVEGESLRARLVREKQLPVEEAVQIATAVAGALDYAHRHGVIHRDLKPENILMHDGQPLVADFGIALAVSNAGGNRITQTGLSLGTPQYMSPEQATGDRTIDARTDVYSLGAVVYEMLTGDAPHTGSSSQAIIARMLTEKPRSIQASRPNVPHHVAAAVEHALEKLPADRWATAKEFSEALAGTRPVTVASALPSQAGLTLHGAPRRVVPVERIAWAAALVLGVGLAYWAGRPAAAPPPVAGRFVVELPESVGVNTASAHTLAISSDGSTLAMLGERSGMRMIYVRRLEDPVAQPVRGTDGALYHSFSADGRALLFIVDNVLKTVPLEGGTPQTLADSSGLASWGAGRSVVYGFREGLWRVSSDGGDRRLVVAPDSARGIVSLRYPDVLPDGQRALTTIVPAMGMDSARIGLVSLADGSLTDLGIVGRYARYSATGHIVFARAGGFVFAVPFSLKEGRVTGAPALLLERVVMAGPGAVALAVARNGTIAYEAGSGGGTVTMFLVDRSGRERSLKGPPRMFREPRVSPDGRRIAVRLGSGSQDGGLWIHDIASGALTRLTADSANIRGEWTKDGREVVYLAAAASPAVGINAIPWNGSAISRRLADGQWGDRPVWQVSLGPPRGFSVLRRGAQGDLYVARSESLGVSRLLTSATAATEYNPRVSPDGRLVSYTSNVTGRSEVYVTTLPGPGPHVQVSVDGGSEGVWSPAGSVLYYRGPSRMMAATIGLRPELAVVRRDSLFADVYRRFGAHSAYDVMPNGREFVMARGQEVRSSMHVVVNWPQLTRLRGAEGER